tara:strand:+ start:196 stop:1161 length:966 start_codon:yes stop_codon:yes gene_type:complete
MSYTQLTEVERYQIQAFLKAGYSQKAIAGELNRHPSTIGRELSRNTGLRGYRPQQAQRLAEERKSLHCHTQITASCWKQVEGLLREDWSPEQIHGWLDNQRLPTVSPEWIYQYILHDKAKGGNLYTHLRCQKQRKKRYGSADKRGQLKNRVSIDERPAVVDRRNRIGDWEIDTVIGRQGGAVLVTAAERKTRLSVVALSTDKTAKSVKDALVEALTPFVTDIKTLTYDNGKEFALHETIAEKLQAKGYFAHPYHSWERGLNENMNGLIRQYAPKGSCFDSLTEDDVKRIMSKLNNRPRKCLGFKTPNEVMFGIKPMIALAN